MTLLSFWIMYRLSICHLAEILHPGKRFDFNFYYAENYITYILYYTENQNHPQDGTFVLGTNAMLVSHIIIIKEIIIKFIMSRFHFGTELAWELQFSQLIQRGPRPMLSRIYRLG